MPSRNPTQTSAAHNQPATIFVALELSKAIWLAAVHTPLADRIDHHCLQAGDARGVVALIAERRARVAAALGRPVRVLFCYEAASPAVGPAQPDPCDGFWLHRLLERHDIDNRVLDPASLLVTPRARRQDRPPRCRGPGARADGAGARRAAGGERGAGAERG